MFLCRNIVKKLITVIVVIAMFTAFMPAIAFADETGETPQEKNCALTTEHVRYISPDSLGKFSPTKKLTKGAAAQMRIARRLRRCCIWILWGLIRMGTFIRNGI